MAAILAKEGHLPVPFFDFACRALFHQVRMANQMNRKRTWSEGIGRLDADGGWLSQQALFDLDSLLGELATHGSLTPIEALTDLLMLVPDIQSLRELQSRRTSALIENKAWDDAMAASILEMMLAAGCVEGPAEASAKYLGIARRANVSPARQEALLKAIFTEPVVESTQDGNEEDSSAIAPVAVDSVLRAKAKAVIAGVPSGLPTRRRAFGNIFAGNAEAGLRDMHSILAGTRANTCRLLDAFDNISVGLAVVDGHVRDSRRFARWLGGDSDFAEGSLNDLDSAMRTLARCETGMGNAAKSQPDDIGGVWKALESGERSSLARSLEGYVENRILGWAADALRANDRQSAVALWSLAMNARGADDSQPLFGRIAETVVFVGKADAADILADLSACLANVPVKILALKEAAKTSYKNKAYEKCLMLYDQLASLPDGQNMENGLAKATALIHLRRYSQARQFVRQLAFSRFLPGDCGQFPPRRAEAAWSSTPEAARRRETPPSLGDPQASEN